MKVIFPVMGAENISVAYLCTVLKEGGHTAKVAFDRALFDDKQYFTIPFLNRLFSDWDGVVDAIVAERPDVLALSVFSDNYQWALGIAREVRKRWPCVTVFGGIHPTSCPDEVISQPEVDYVIVSEGEKPLLQLLDALETGGSLEGVGNLVYQVDGAVRKNPILPLMDPTTFPAVDKSVFEKFIPMRSYYLTVTSKGCIQTCTFCMQNFLKKFEEDNHLGRFLREKPVDVVIAEFKEMKERYGLKYIDIKNNVLSGNKRWLNEFLERYAAEVALPFRIMCHPLLLQGDLAERLKKAGCHHIQMGIESMNPVVRREVLNRDETNEQVIKALDSIERAGINFSADIIVGLPGESEQDLIDAIRVLSRYKHLIRASIFWLQYLPKVAITESALQSGLINAANESMIIKGLQDNYLSTGSPMEDDRKRILKTYHLIFRLLPILSEKAVTRLLDSGLYRAFHRIPLQVALIIAIDVFVSYLRKDYYAKWIMGWYIRHVFGKMFRRTVYVSD